MDTFLGRWCFRMHFAQGRNSISAAGFQELFKTGYFIHRITLNVATLIVPAGSCLAKAGTPTASYDTEYNLELMPRCIYKGYPDFIGYINLFLLITAFFE